MDEPGRLGATLVALRERLAWSQEEAAARIGVSRNALGAWEQGKAKPRPQAMQQVAEAYGVTPAQLLSGEVPGVPTFDPVSFAAGRQAAFREMLGFLHRVGVAGAPLMPFEEAQAMRNQIPDAEARIADPRRPAPSGPEKPRPGPRSGNRPEP